MWQVCFLLGTCSLTVLTGSCSHSSFSYSDELQEQISLKFKGKDKKHTISFIRKACHQYISNCSSENWTHQYLRLGFWQSSLITSRVTLSSSLSWSVTWRKKVDCNKLSVCFTVDGINVKKESKALMYSKNLHHHNYSLHVTLPPGLIMNVKFSITFFKQC